jgi:hypothetical protein
MPRIKASVIYTSKTPDIAAAIQEELDKNNIPLKDRLPHLQKLQGRYFNALPESAQKTWKLKAKEIADDIAQSRMPKTLR